MHGSVPLSPNINGRSAGACARSGSRQAFGTLHSMTRSVLVLSAACMLLINCSGAVGAQGPNILFAIWDDVSYPHVSAAGSKMVSTPAFDRIASEGVMFRNAYAPAPGCSPTRAAFLTGRHIWMIEQAGTHASSFPQTYVSYQDLLEEAGYAVGYTGKPWGPGRWEKSGRTRNPAGPAFLERTSEPPFSGMRNWDYAGKLRGLLRAQAERAAVQFLGRWQRGAPALRARLLEEGGQAARGRRGSAVSSGCSRGPGGPARLCRRDRVV